MCATFHRCGCRQRLWKKVFELIRLGFLIQGTERQSDKESEREREGEFSSNLYTCFPYKIPLRLFGGFSLVLSGAVTVAVVLSCFSYSRPVIFPLFALHSFLPHIYSTFILPECTAITTWYCIERHVVREFHDFHVKTFRKGVYYVWYCGCVHTHTHTLYVEMWRETARQRKEKKDLKLNQKHCTQRRCWPLQLQLSRLDGMNFIPTALCGPLW